MININRLIFISALALSQCALAQSDAPLEIHGDFQTDFQTYKADSLIGAKEVPEKSGSNTYLNLTVSKGEFSSGVRMESYTPALQGFDARYKDTSMPYKFLSFKNDKVFVTVGNFYEQFGNALILRTYWDPNLGYDNSFNGVRVNVNPGKGIYIKSLVGKQRLYATQGDGMVRGVDGELSFNELLQFMENSETQLTIGGSFVSKYQKANHPLLNLPANVGAWAARANISHKAFTLLGEYAYKTNDPTANNVLTKGVSSYQNFKPGQALYVSSSYSVKDFGVTLSTKYIDNMDYRSDRGATGNDLMINYTPALTPQHVYSLAALYPYASQPNGEFCLQGDINYNIERGSWLGGKYGTKLWINFAQINGIQKTAVDNNYIGYESNLMTPNDTLNYYKNLNFEINKRITKDFKLIASYLYIQRNDAVLKLSDYHGMITSHVAVMDMSYKFLKKHTMRMELQHLWTQQDKGNWATVLLEYQTSAFFAALVDDYNYGNSDSSKQIHYLMGSVGYKKKTTRISAAYGKRRQGIICVGGVCRQVPASNGLALTVTTSF